MNQLDHIIELLGHRYDFQTDAADVSGSLRRGVRARRSMLQLVVVDDDRAGAVEHAVLMGHAFELRFTALDTWAPCMLFTTGGPRIVQRLCDRACARGWLLDATGLHNSLGERLDDNSEEHLFALLDLPYLEPEER
jgi:DNA polymerase/3'-5' exonuclease PolX